MRETLQSAEPYPAPADMALIGDVLKGDAQAFETLMRRHNRRLFRVARSILRDDSEAEDALQDGYIQAFRNLQAFRGDAQLSTWLTRIVVNAALERRRRGRTPVDADAEVESFAAGPDGVFPETPESLTMRGELRRVMEHAIDGLPEEYRSVFMLRAVEGLSVEETAASLGISEGNTKVRFSRARARLRDALGRQLGPLIENVFAFDGRRCDRIVAHVCDRLGLSVPALPAPGELL